MNCILFDPVFKNSMEWKKSEVAESDFYTDFFDEQYQLLVNHTNFLMNIDDFSEIGPGRSRRISAIFKKISRIFKPWFDQVSLLRGTTFRLETNSLSTNARGRGDI
jgi:hypothetical protein